MGPGTPYRVLHPSNPFLRQARSDQGGPRAWNHGSWSGAEWQAEAVVPLRLHARAASRDLAGGLELRHEVAAAFAAVGDSGETVALRFVLGGREHVMFGRPRMSEPELATVGLVDGEFFVSCAFVAQDPRIYAGELSEVSTGLPTQTGGLTLPFTVPFTIPGVLTGGREDLLNEGTADAALLLRVDGPVTDPRIALQRPDGDVQTIRFDLTLAAGQWLDIDTASRTALLNGLPEANQRGRAAWDIDPYPLPPGTSVLRFAASSHNDEALLTARWRSAWW
jgi:hypothetical protein